MVEGENLNLARGGYGVGILRGWRLSDIPTPYPPSGRLRFPLQPCVLAFIPQIAMILTHCHTTVNDVSLANAQKPGKVPWRHRHLILFVCTVAMQPHLWRRTMHVIAEPWEIDRIHGGLKTLSHGSIPHGFSNICGIMDKYYINRSTTSCFHPCCNLIDS